MTKIAQTAGHFDIALTSVATKVRQPVFVDNAVHYAKIEPRSDGKSRVTIEAVNNENYDIATEKAYTIAEAESAIYLSHKETDGHSYKNAVWTTKGKNAVTSLLYGETNDSARLIGNSLTSTTIGMQIDLRNMKGKKLKDLGFDDNAVRMGQIVDVGYRTSDLAIKLASDITGSITVDVGDSMTTANSSNRRRHTNTFVASDFNNVNLITALRYLSRHDNGTPIFNRFGVLMYMPMNYTSKTQFIDANLRLGSRQKSGADNVFNRVSIQGRQIALNEPIIVTMDDRTKQQGRFDNDVIEEVTPVFDASVTSVQQARRVARRMLKANASIKGKVQSSGHPHNWHIRPGDMVYYDSKKYMVIEALHKMAENTSDFVFLSAETGLEGVLQGILEGGITEKSLNNKDTNNQIKEENFSFFSTYDITILPLITVTEVGGSGILIGGNGDRGKIGGNYKKIGLNKGTPIIITGEL